MSPKEVEQIMNWIAQNLANLPMDEQLVIQMALVKMCENIKPIYDKHNSFKFLM